MSAPPAWTPPVSVPSWHPFLRTASLLRLRREDADALVALAAILGKAGPRARHSVRRSPFRACALVGLDLVQCLDELEIFEEDRSIPYRRSVLAVRRRVHQLVQSLRLMVDLPPEADPWCPVRQVARLWLPEAVWTPFFRLATTAGECSAEVCLRGHVVDDGAWASGVGAACDLSLLADVLHQAARSCEGLLCTHLEGWASELRQQSRALVLGLPGEPMVEQDLEITRTEIPVAAAGDGRFATGTT